ncbi:FecCD family ABC transporter permease [Massilia violaceinigra]|nr:iron ABC transporter permease [Massilia violaceinigra]
MSPSGRIALLVPILPALLLASMLTGAGEAGMADLRAVLAGGDNSPLQMIVRDVRAPRTLAALLVGAALGVAGMLMQTVTRNRLAEPGLLGVNAGAALGVVTGITLAGAESGLAYLLWAGAGALLGNACVLGVANAGRQSGSPLRLVLAGVALGATFHGLSSAMLLSQPSGYDQYRFWVLGSLAGSSGGMIMLAAPFIIFGLLAALFLARPLSAMLLGDDIARSLGHSPRLLRAAVAFTATLLTGSAVALTGPIAFLGLLAPFLARALAQGLAAQLAASAWVGAIVLLFADLGARLVAQPFETPISVLTALLGAPLLVWLARGSIR